MRRRGVIDGRGHPACPMGHLAGDGGGHPALSLLLSHRGTAGWVFGDASGKGRKGSVPRGLGSRAEGQGWLYAERGGHGPEVLVGCKDGANRRSSRWDRVLILAVVASSIANPICPRSACFGSRWGCSGRASRGWDVRRRWLELGAQPSPTQAPPDLHHQHLNPQFIKKQLIPPTPPTPPSGFMVSVSSRRLQGSN